MFDGFTPIHLMLSTRIFFLEVIGALAIGQPAAGSPAPKPSEGQGVKVGVMARAGSKVVETMAKCRCRPDRLGYNGCNHITMDIPGLQTMQWKIYDGHLHNVTVLSFVHLWTCERTLPNLAFAILLFLNWIALYTALAWTLQLGTWTLPRGLLSDISHTGICFIFILSWKWLAWALQLGTWTLPRGLLSDTSHTGICFIFFILIWNWMVTCSSCMNSRYVNSSKRLALRHFTHWHLLFFKFWFGIGWSHAALAWTLGTWTLPRGLLSDTSLPCMLFELLHGSWSLHWSSFRNLSPCVATF